MSARIATREPSTPPADCGRLTAPSDLERYLSDAAHLRGEATAACRAETEGEWSRLLSGDTPLIVSAARSSLTGGATPKGQLVASTERLVDIRSIASDRARVQAGVPLARLREALAAKGLVYPPIPTYDGCFLGGTIATNAAGAQTFKHGDTRRWVRALTVVLPGGDVLDVERGECVAEAGAHFEIERRDGTITRVPAPHHALPDVPKLSAGYWSAGAAGAGNRLDLVDLFVGSEGTLGVVLEAEVAVVRRSWAQLGVLALLEREEDALALVAELRAEALRTWATNDGAGLDIASIECLDRRCLELLRDDATPARLGIDVARRHAMALVIGCELPAELGSIEVQDALVTALESDEPAAGPVATLARLLARFDAVENAVLALPGDEARWRQIHDFREAAPEAVNARIGRARRDGPPGIHKIAGDVIVPFERQEELLATARTMARERGLDLATWGHVSDGNLHPNVLPRSLADVEAGNDFLLALGRWVIEAGGSPLAEHGVGRHPVKQRLLRELVGADGIAGMRAVKQALDPQGLLAPGVLLPADEVLS